MLEIAVLLHNVRSTYNVGAVLRSADGAGVSKVFLTGYTPSPTDRFGRARSDIAKTALGAEKSVVWEYALSSARLITRLKKEGWTIVGVEQDMRAVEYRAFACPQRTVFVFGNEVRGLSKQVRDQCDSLIEIPMRGRKESLNVSVTVGIILFHFNR